MKNIIFLGNDFLVFGGCCIFCSLTFSNFFFFILEFKIKLGYIIFYESKTYLLSTFAFCHCRGSLFARF